MFVVDVVGHSDELKCAAFMFLKVSLHLSVASNNSNTCFQMMTLCSMMQKTCVVDRCGSKGVFYVYNQTPIG